MTVTPSVVSVAVKTGAPAVVDLTVKVATPEPSVVPDTVVMVGVPGPEVLASVTVLPATAFPAPSFKVTVIVEVVTPSAVTEAGDGTTVEPTALAPKVTVAVCVMVTLSPVAVKTGEPAVKEVTVKVTTPDALETPEAAEIVSVAPRLDTSDTVLPATRLP